MNTQSCRISFTHSTIYVSKKFLIQASKPFSEEYLVLTKLRKDHPDYRVETIKKQPSKIFMPTFEEMMMRMEAHPERDNLMLEFEHIRRMATATGNGYMFVRNWFIDRIKENQNTSVAFELN